MQRFRQSGTFAVEAGQLQQARRTFLAARCDDAETKRTIRAVSERDGMLVDPHTAIGIAASAAISLPSDVAKVCIATAHAAKFPDAVEAASGIRPALPERLASLMSLPERCSSLPANVDALARAIAEAVKLRGVMV